MFLATKKAVWWQDAKVYFLQERVDLTPDSIKSYVCTLNRLLRGRDVSLVGRLHILQFLQGYSNAGSYNTNLYAIKAFFEWASEFYQIPNPAIGLKCKRQNAASNVRVITEKEYKGLFKLDGHYRDVAIFLANTGLRASEFCGLRSQNIFDHHLDFVGKGGKRRKVPLNKTALSLLRKYKGKINYQFSKSHYCKYHYLEYARERLAVLADIDPFMPHALRHRFATILISKGANIGDVSKLLGHADIKTTINLYYHPDDLSDCVGLLDF